MVSPSPALKSVAVSVPEPPAKRSAPRPPVSLSFPLPPHIRSFAPWALSVSEPFLAKIMSASALPVRVLLAALPDMTLTTTVPFSSPVAYRDGHLRGAAAGKGAYGHGARGVGASSEGDVPIGQYGSVGGGGRKGEVLRLSVGV